jgi:flagellar motor component MotA
MTSTKKLAEAIVVASETSPGFGLVGIVILVVLLGKNIVRLNKIRSVF